MAGKISDLTAITGANVDVAADMMELRDTSAGSSGSKSILISELKAALGLPAYEVHIYRNANQTGVLASTVTDLTFNAEILDVGGIYSATTYVVVPTGMTQMMCVLYCPQGNDGYCWIEERTSGGSSVAIHGGRGRASSDQRAVSGWQAVTAGNRIFGVVFNSTAGTITITNNAWPATGANTAPTNMWLAFR